MDDVRIDRVRVLLRHGQYGTGTIKTDLCRSRSCATEWPGRVREGCQATGQTKTKARNVIRVPDIATGIQDVDKTSALRHAER